METFEFDSDHDETIARLGIAMQRFGGLTLTAGSLGVGGALLSLAFLSMFSGAVALAVLVGWALLAIVAPWITVGTGRRLMQIPRTEGDDLALLSHSLRGIATIYSLQVAGWIAYIVAIVIAAVKVLS